MRKMAMLGAGAALLLLGGCDRLGIGGGLASNEVANASGNSAGSKDQPAAGNASAGNGAGLADKDPGAVQASAGGPAVDRNWLIGRWTDEDDCDRAADFMASGDYVTADGEAGEWRLDGDMLTMSNAAVSRTVRIVPVGADVMDVINAGGGVGRSTRC